MTGEARDFPTVDHAQHAGAFHSFADAVTRLARIGYTGVEIMADVPHAWPAYLLPEQKQVIRDALVCRSGHANKLDEGEYSGAS